MSEEFLDKEPMDDSEINAIIVKSKIAKNCPSCDCLIGVDDNENKVQFFKEQAFAHIGKSDSWNKEKHE